MTDKKITLTRPSASFKSTSFKMYNSNIAVMATAQKIVPKEVKIEGESKEVSIAKIVDAVDAHKIEHSDEQTDTKVQPERDPFHVAEARKNMDKLTFSSIVGDSAIEMVNDLVSKRTEERFAAMRAEAKEIDLNYSKFGKNFIQCSNLFEFYDFKDKANAWVFVRL